MTASLRTAPRLLLALALAATAAVVLAPGLVPDPRQRGDSFTPPGWFPAEKRPPGGEPVRWSGGLGTDYLGRPFVLVLCKGFSGTVRIALLGTAAVVAGCVMVGALHGSARSRGLEALVAAGNLGVMAVPEVAVLITLAVAWPRTAPPLWVNLSMVAVLVLFAVPTGARLIADRVRAVQRSGFVAASRAYGAGPAHVFRHEVWPHLVEGVAWVAAAVLPRFIAVEVGLAYLGVEYRDFEGLGRTLSKSFSNLNDRTASFQLLVTIAAVLWAALLPQLALRLLGLRSRRQEGRSMSHGNVLEVRRLSVRSERGQPILDEVSLELRAGEVTALVGETGSGKTTFINGILGLLPAGLRFSGGEVLLNVEGGAVDLLRLPDRRRRDYLGRQIGYVPQDVRAGLNPLMTARATVLEAVRRGGLPGPAAARADDAMRRAGLPAEFIRHDAGRRPGRLSGGQCQRVLIAQAVANEPSLLLLDEPTASLDPPTRREVRATIRALAGERRAVCLVTHDVASLPGLADTIGVMYLGRLIESGPADELLARPTHPYLRGLLGCVPRLDRRAPLHPIPGEPPGNLADVPGCPFHPRCPAREERCRVEVPLSRDVSPARKVACHVDLADGV